jgi:cation transport regulator ChaC
VWIFGYGSVLSLHYNNKPAVYFEGISRKLPDNYARIYYFKYETDSFTLKFQGEELKKKNK